MIINTNISALNTIRNMQNTQSSLSKSLERLSSGFRINRAADDAAGLAISETMRAQIKGLNQAQRNAQDGVSLIQTAEGGLNEIHSILQRMRELSVQANNGTYSASDKINTKKEMDDLVSQIDTISKTQFNGVNLISSGAASISLQVGSGKADQMVLHMEKLSSTAASLGVASASVDVTGTAITTVIGQLDKAISKVSGYRAQLGADQNRLEHTITTLSTTSENLTAAESRIRDVDMAQEMSTFTKNQILQQAGTAMLAQANQQPQSVLKLLG